MCCFEHGAESLDFVRNSECYCQHNCLGKNPVILNCCFAGAALCSASSSATHYRRVAAACGSRSAVVSAHLVSGPFPFHCMR